MKSIFASRTFWMNLLGGAVAVAQLVPPKYSIPALAIANMGMRLISNQGVYVIPPSK